MPRQDWRNENSTQIPPQSINLFAKHIVDFLILKVVKISTQVAKLGHKVILLRDCIILGDQRGNGSKIREKI